METPEMHVMFRQYAQQMGMQNVRAILPEQIDLLLNTSQMDLVNQIIKENIGITNDRVITDNSKIGQINALRNLYKVQLVDLSPKPALNAETRLFNFKASDRNTGRMTTAFKKLFDNTLLPDYLYLVDFSINYKKTKDSKGYNGKDEIINKKTYSVLTPRGAVDAFEDYSIYCSNIDDDCNISAWSSESFDEHSFELVEDQLDGIEIKTTPKLKCKTTGFTDYYLGVEGESEYYYGGVHYVLTKNFRDGDGSYNNGFLYNPVVVSNKHSDYTSPEFEDDSVETNYFPVRLIDDAYLSDTLNDFVLKNRLRSPIIVTYNNNTFDLYIDKFYKASNGTYTLDGGLIPYTLRMSYISAPNEIYYGEDVGKENKHSNLPEYMHVDVVKHAVDLYRMAISGSMMAAQQQEKNATQENMRNNYRNEDNTRQ